MNRVGTISRILRRTMASKSVNSTSQNSFNSNHSLYDQVRPEFKFEFVKSFLTDLGLAKKDHYYHDKRILELAAGTGKFTKNIVKAGWENQNQLVIVEPSEGMITSFKSNFPTVRAELGSSYKIPLEDSSVDAVIIAQGFHWFADKESLEEIYRVLKPKGKLGLIWNFDATSYNVNLQKTKAKFSITPEDEKTKEGWEKLSIRGHKSDGDVPQYRKAWWRRVFENQSYFDAGNYVEEFTYQILPFETARIYDYWLSRSFVTSLPDDQKAVLKKDLDEIVAGLPDYNFTDASHKYINQFLGTEYFVIESQKSK